MIDSTHLLVICLSGAACGALFFGGLWCTTRLGLRSRYPARWFMGSFLVRSAVLVMAFAALTTRGWQPMLMGLSGFFGIRWLMQLCACPTRIAS